MGQTKKEMQRERCKGNDEKKEKQTMSNLLNEARFKGRETNTVRQTKREMKGGQTNAVRQTKK